MTEIKIDDLRKYRKIKSAIRGLQLEIETLPERADILRESLQKNEAKLQQIENFIKTADPITAKIMTLHFVRGYSWEQTCAQIYNYPDPDTCRKAVSRFFQKQNKSR